MKSRPAGTLAILTADSQDFASTQFAVDVTVDAGDPEPLANARLTYFTTDRSNSNDLGGVDYNPTSGNFWCGTDKLGPTDSLQQRNTSSTLVSEIFVTGSSASLADVAVDRDDNDIIYFSHGNVIKKWRISTGAQVSSWTPTGITVHQVRGITWPTGDYYYITYEQTANVFRIAKIAKATNVAASSAAWSSSAGVDQPYCCFFYGSTFYVGAYDQATGTISVVQLWDTSLSLTKEITLHSSIVAINGLTFDGTHWWIRERTTGVATNPISKVESGGGTKTLTNLESVSINNAEQEPPTATTVIRNDDGTWLVDDETSTNYLALLEGKAITIDLGLEGYTKPRKFTGYIVETTDQLTPEGLTLTVQAVGVSGWYGDRERALVDDGAGAFGQLSITDSPEAIFSTIWQRVGVASGDIVTDTSSRTVTLTWENEGAIDLSQRLCEMTGWTWWEDDDGDLHFGMRREYEPRIESTPEVLTMTGTTAQALANSPVVTGSVTVKNTADSVTYTINTDYTVAYDPATITRVAGGAITDGQQVNARYSYAARVYEENQVFAVEMTRSIRDIRRKLRYRSTTSAPAAITSDHDYASADTYNLNADNWQYIDVPGPVTQADLDQIRSWAGTYHDALRRPVTIDAVCDPWLEVGDTVQPLITRLTMSDLYRIIRYNILFELGRCVQSFDLVRNGYVAL